MSAPDKKFNAAQLRLLQVIEILSGHEVHGLRLIDVASALKLSSPTVIRDLQALEEGGWAWTKEERWRLGAKPIQMLANVQWGLQKAGIELAEIRSHMQLPGNSGDKNGTQSN